MLKVSISSSIFLVPFTTQSNGSSAIVTGIRLSANTEGEVKAGDIELDADLEIMNPDLVICTLVKGGKIDMEMTVGNGRGYVDSKENKKLLDLIANTLLEHETLTKEQIEYLVDNGCLPDEDGEVDKSDFKDASLDDLTTDELIELAREKGIKGASKMTKEELIEKLEEDE